MDAAKGTQTGVKGANRMFATGTPNPPSPIKLAGTPNPPSPIKLAGTPNPPSPRFN